MGRIWQVIVCVLPVLWLGATAARAQDSRARAESAPRKVVVGLPDPAHTRGLLQWIDGDIDGLARQITETILRRAGYEIEVRKITGSGGDVEALENGDVDVLVAISVMESRMRRVSYSAPILFTRGCVYSRPGAEEIVTAEGLRDKRVAVAGGGIAQQWALERTVSVAAYPLLNLALQAVANGDADYCVTTQAAGRFDIEKYGIKGLRESTIDDPKLQRAFSMAVAYGNDALLSVLNRGLAEMQASGEFDSLYERWAKRYQPRSTRGLVEMKDLVLPTMGIAAVMGVALVGSIVLVRKLGVRTKQLRQSEELYKAVAENLPGMVHSYFVSDDGKSRELLFENGMAREWKARFPRLALGGKYEDNWRVDIHPDDVGAYDAAVEVARRTKSKFTAECRVRDVTGLYRWLHIVVMPFLVRGGTVWQALFVDVTDQRRAVEAAQEAHAKFVAIAETLPALVYAYFVSKDGRREQRFLSSRITEWAERFPFLKPGLWVAEFYDAIHPDDREAERVATELSRNSGAPFEVQYRLRAVDGEYRWVYSRLTARAEEGGLLWQGILLDTTEQHRTAERLRVAEERYRQIFERSHEAIVVFRPETEEVLDVNPAACELYGFSREEFVGASLEIVSLDVAKGKERIRATVEQGAMTYSNWRQRRRDGTEIEVEVSAVMIDFGGAPAIASLNRDQSARLAAERDQRQLEEKLRETQKLESLGIMAGGIAHDFNNILVGVLGNAAVAVSMTEEGSEIRKTLDRVQTAARRAADLTRELLAYSGRTRIDREEVDLGGLVREMAELLDVSIGAGTSLHFEIDGEISPVLADATQMRQVVMNLITNAAEAMNGAGGRVELRLFETEVDAEGIARLDASAPAMSPGRYVCLQASDTGHGMSPEVRGRIFEPFFTTKFAGRGLGLSAVLGIVRGHGGGIGVRSRAGEGSVFSVYLPPAPCGVVVRVPEPETLLEMKPGGASVLVVDDEAIVLELNAEVLRRAGYAVTAVSGGVAAVKSFEAGEKFDAVLLDLTMPGLGGAEVFRLLRRMQPGLPIVLTSGYTVDDAPIELLRAERTAFLQKPHTPDELLAKLREAMRGATVELRS